MWFEVIAIDNFERMVWLLLIFFGILFCAGLVCGILSLVFVIKKKHPVVSIIFSVVCWFGLCIPVEFTVGELMYGYAVYLVGIYSVVMIVLSVGNMIHSHKKTDK